jgi:hypothetical protein
MKACPRSQLPKEIGDRKIICFGAGRSFKTFLDYNKDISQKIIGVIDNNSERNGSLAYGYPVYSLGAFLKREEDNIVICITSSLYYGSILAQLDEIESFDGVDCYLDIWNRNKLEKQDFIFRTGEQKIPKKIHYCWFGGKAIPAHLQQCIDSWKKYCPDYEIIRWDESNYDIHKNRYMLQAYQAEKYGFVPDYARLDIVRQHGGIYLDTDVELVRNLDPLLCYDFYCGFEDEHYIALGLGFGAVAGHPLLGKMLAVYQELDFIRDGKINDVASPYYQSKVMEEEGYQLNGRYQDLDGVGIFPHDVLAPGGSLLLPDERTKNTFSIHHYDASWMAKCNEVQKRHKDLRQLYMERVQDEKNGVHGS